jgi:hypothetical protein
MTFAWENTGDTLSREGIARALGDEWADAWEFYARMVNHMTLEAAPHGDLGMAAAEMLRERIRAQIPASLEEVVPFAVRYLWNHSIEGPERGAFFVRLQSISRLAGGTWELEELARRVEDILRS